MGSGVPHAGIQIEQLNEWLTPIFKDMFQGLKYVMARMILELTFYGWANQAHLN